MPNETALLPPEQIHVFDRLEIRVLLCVLYALVFVLGLVGNVMVIIVIRLHPRMRTTTNFFLTNLAAADLCVTLFCVLQNLSLYLTQTWIFGDFFCKIYNFVHHLSYVASIAILVVTCIERYLAIMWPVTAKELLTHRNLVGLLILVWLGSAIYCCPRILYFKTVDHVISGAPNKEIICLADREVYNTKIFDTINFVFLYVIPLIVISIFYFRIGHYLWVNGIEMEKTFRETVITGPQNGIYYSQEKQRAQHEYEMKPLSLSSSSHHFHTFQSKNKNREYACGPYHTAVLLQSWRKVLRLLVTLVVCFAICNLPFHLRKMLSYYSPSYNFTTDAALLATPLTNLFMYLNSALNPVMYSFMSYNFRSCVRDVVRCQYIRKHKRKTQQISTIFN